MRWNAGTLSVLDDASARARSGRPTVLLVEGEAGIGKTAVLGEAHHRAADFQVFTTAGSQADSTPYDTLNGLGVAAKRTADGRYAEPFVVAQQLRELLDRHRAEPVMLRVDDLHWADPETLRAIIALFERASGDRLLLAAASRPGGGHPEWLRWAADSPDVLRLKLSGLDFSTAVDLAREHRPGMDAATIRALWEHTAGNPLYLTALLSEHDDRALRRSRVLPAPAAFVQVMQNRLLRSGPDAESLMRAVVVLGPGWASLFDAADLAAVRDPDAAAQSLVEAELARIREIDGRVELSAVHALVRSAVYQQIPLPERRRLHTRAAQLIGPGGAALEHRVAAATRYDPELSTELAAAGWESYRQGLARQGAQRLRWSSSLTADPELRESRRLDALYLNVMGREIATVRDDLEAVGPATAGPRQAAVLGAYALLTGQVANSIAILEAAVRSWPATPDDAEESQALRYRLETLLAWARIGGGNSAEFLDGLATAAERGLVDPQLVGLVGFAQGLVRVRLHGAEAELDRLAPLPRDPAQIPLGLTFVLAWRGLLELVLGLFDKALADQLEMLRRVNAGLVTDTSSGGIGAYLATSYWSIGEGDLARLHFRMAAESDAALSVVPLLGLFGLEPAARGDVHAADQWAARAELAAEGGQWPETPQNLLMARVVRLRAAGTAAERAALLPSLQRRWPDAMRGVGLIGVPWLSYATLAAVWSGQLELAESFVDRLRSGSPRPAWSAAIAEWLTGLIAEARGDLATALGHLELAAAADPPPPLQRGYLLTDLVRLRAAQGRRDGNEELRAEAMSMFRRLGAQPSETTPPPAPATPLPPPAQPGTSVVGGYGLSERERDVVTLVSVGMSYQQIARELFITRSTVGFHLSNIYAKAGVTSRHELTALLRSNPASFGLAAVAR